MAHKPTDYKATALWHSDSGSYGYYIQQMQAKAAEQQVPLDALYEQYGPSGPTGTWVCISDLSANHPFRERFRRVHG